MAAFGIFCCSCWGALSVLVCAAAAVGEANAGGDAAPPSALRRLMSPSVAGAVQVSGMSRVNQALNGLYFPTAEVVNEQQAFKKDASIGPANLWLVLNKNHLWNIVPEGPRTGSEKALAIAKTSGHDSPGEVGVWRIFDHEANAWEPEASIKVALCEGGSCEEDYEPIATLPEDRVDHLLDATAPVSCHDETASSLINPHLANCSPWASATWQTWACLVLGSLVLAMQACCAMNGQNVETRSYFWTAIANMVTLWIGFVVASQLVPLLSFGMLPAKWHWIPLQVLFMVGFFALHFVCWKCQFSPVRRTVSWTLGAHVVAGLGIFAFRGPLWLLEEEFGGKNIMSVPLVNTLFLLIVMLVLFFYSAAARGLRQKQFKDPSPKSWPKQAMTVEKKAKEGGAQGGFLSSLPCLGGGAGEGEMEEVQVPTEPGYHWTVDALLAQNIVVSLVMAFMLHGFVLLTGGVVDVGFWALICLALLGVVCIFGFLMRRQGEHKSHWVGDFLLASTASRLLGLSLYTFALTLVSFLRGASSWEEEEGDWWMQPTAALEQIAIVFILSSVSMAALMVLGRLFRRRQSDGEFGAMPLPAAGHFPQEVVGISVMLAWAWFILIEGAVQRVVVETWLFRWNADFCVAVPSFVLVGGLYLVWRSALLPRAEERLRDHDEDVAHDKGRLMTKSLKDQYGDNA